MLPADVTMPLLYEKIPTQYVFMVNKDGLLRITQVTDIPKQIQFKSEQEARDYVAKYEVQL